MGFNQRFYLTEKEETLRSGAGVYGWPRVDGMKPGLECLEPHEQSHVKSVNNSMDLRPSVARLDWSGWD